MFAYPLTHKAREGYVIRFIQGLARIVIQLKFMEVLTMSEIIGYIISFVVAYLLSLAIVLLFLLIEDRKREKKMSNSPRTAKNRRAARRQSLKEVRAQINELNKATVEYYKSTVKFDKSKDKLDKAKDEVDKSKDKLAKSVEPLENFYKNQLWDKKNIH